MPFDDCFETDWDNEFYDEYNDGYGYGYDDEIELHDVTVVGETDKALACVINCEQVWIPKSQILWHSQVWKLEDCGTLIIPKWIAKDKGLKEKPRETVQVATSQAERNDEPEETNMGYENAPSTRMLATQCAICSRPLRDAKSVERGVGPECFEKYGVAEAPEIEPDWEEAEKVLGLHLNRNIELRERANSFIHRISLDQGSERAVHYAAALWYLGYRKVVLAIARHRSSVIKAITVTDQTIHRTGEIVLWITAPYNEAFNGLYLRDQMGNIIISASRKREVWAAMKRCYPKGTLVLGKKAVIL